MGGFVDNFFMICFGESVDSQFGLYLSTMAAAGLGNLCSNILGLGLSDYIEHASERLGIRSPRLTARQRLTTLCRLTAFAGTTWGVSVGCLLGMCPLLVFDNF